MGWFANDARAAERFRPRCGSWQMGESKASGSAKTDSQGQPETGQLWNVIRDFDSGEPFYWVYSQRCLSEMTCWRQMGRPSKRSQSFPAPSLQRR